MRIGIIDTGVDHRHSVFENTRLSGITIYKAEDGSVRKEYGIFPDKKGHGTGIASTILEFVPGTELAVVKLDAFNEKITEDLLVAGITYLVEKGDVQMINISMGIRSESPSMAISTACELAWLQNIPLVAAAYHNHLKHEKCYPAFLESVYGVGVGRVGAHDRYRFRYLDEQHNQILAKGDYPQVAAPGNHFWVASGTSFASASFTGIIANAYLQQRWKCHNTLKEWLKEHTDNSIAEMA